MDVPRLLMVC